MQTEKMELILAKLAGKNSKFVGFDYTSKGSGEVSKRLIIINRSYTNFKQRCVELLLGADLGVVVEKFGEELVTVAFDEILNSLNKPTEKKDCYISVNDSGSIQIHKDTGNIHIQGQCHRKKNH